MRCVILAAGRGTRMGPLTVRRAKVALPVAGKPFVAHLVERCRKAGLRDIVMITHHAEEGLRAWFKANPLPDVRIRFVRQEKPQGTGDALRAALRQAGQDLVLLYGDTLPSVEDIRRLSKATNPTLGSWKVKDARPFGALRMRGGRLIEIAEKSPDPPSNSINGGAYRLVPELSRLSAGLQKSVRGEFELTDAVNGYAKAGGRVDVLKLEEWHEVGRPWDLLDLQASLMAGLPRKIEGEVEKGAALRGPVQVGKGTVVKAGTYVEGPVVIGRDCKIGPNAYLRPSTSIGDGCHVGASVEIKNSILMDRSNVPHLSYVGDSIIGSDVNLGAGTSVANLKVTPTNVRVTWEDGTKIDTGRRKFGVIIGDGTKIGINCSLNPGTVVGADCLIGLGRTLAGWIPSGSRLL